MAFTFSQLTNVNPASFSIGPYKVEVYSYLSAGTETSGSISSLRLHEIDYALFDGGVQQVTQTITNTTQPPTYAFTCTAQPSGGCAGYVLLFGK